MVFCRRHFSGGRTKGACQRSLGIRSRDAAAENRMKVARKGLIARVMNSKLGPMHWMFRQSGTESPR
jgi:hypothetical protein